VKSSPSTGKQISKQQQYRDSVYKQLETKLAPTWCQIYAAHWTVIGSLSFHRYGSSAYCTYASDFTATGDVAEMLYRCNKFMNHIVKK